MNQLSLDQTRSVILNATALRAQGRHDDAIALIQANIAQMQPDLVFNANKEIFSAAIAKGDEALARVTARKLAAEFPDLPSIQKYL